MATLGSEKGENVSTALSSVLNTLSWDYEVLNTKKSYQIFYYDQTDGLLKFSP